MILSGCKILCCANCMFCETDDSTVSQHSPETLTISVVSEHHAVLTLDSFNSGPDGYYFSLFHFMKVLTWVKRHPLIVNIDSHFSIKIWNKLPWLAGRLVNPTWSSRGQQPTACSMATAGHKYTCKSLKYVTKSCKKLMAPGLCPPCIHHGRSSSSSTCSEETRHMEGERVEPACFSHSAISPTHTCCWLSNL